MQILRPQIGGATAQFQNPAVWRKVELFKDPLLPTLLVGAEAQVKLDACVQI